MTPEWSTVAEVAARLNIAPKTLRKWIRDGDLPFRVFKVANTWRILTADVDVFLTEVNR
jgi:excisionase family DNA binding protein